MPRKHGSERVVRVFIEERDEIFLAVPRTHLRFAPHVCVDALPVLRHARTRARLWKGRMGLFRLLTDIAKLDFRSFKVDPRHDTIPNHLLEGRRVRVRHPAVEL